MKASNINDILNNIYDEFMATGAWCGHCYGFENMGEYYVSLVEFMQENNLPTDDLIRSYNAVVEEFNRISSSENMSFLNAEDTKELEKLDSAFLDIFACSAQAVADFTENKNLIFA